jgi:pheromone shutdown protein TraB
VWQKGRSRRITLLGTAHISTLSADLAGQLVRDIRPDAVFVELDAKRVGKAVGNVVVVGSSAASRRSDAMIPEVVSSSAVPASVVVVTSPAMEQETVPSPAPPRGLGQRLRQSALQAGSAAVGTAVKSMYSKLNQSGFNAGEEFVVAVREGRQIGATIVLGDRDVEMTLRRLTEALAQTDLTELMSPDSELEKSMSELLPGPPPSQDMSDADFKQEMSIYVETMKAKENVRKIMGQLKKSAPLIYQALVEERDVYMATGLNSLNQFSSIVAVMGIAHMEGVENTLVSFGWQQVPLKCPRK